MNTVGIGHDRPDFPTHLFCQTPFIPLSSWHLLHRHPRKPTLISTHCPHQKGDVSTRPTSLTPPITIVQRSCFNISIKPTNSHPLHLLPKMRKRHCNLHKHTIQPWVSRHPKPSFPDVFNSTQRNRRHSFTKTLNVVIKQQCRSRGTGANDGLHIESFWTASMQSLDMLHPRKMLLNVLSLHLPVLT